MTIEFQQDERSIPDRQEGIATENDTLNVEPTVISEPLPVLQPEITVPVDAIHAIMNIEKKISMPAKENPKRETANVATKPENKKRLSITVNFPGEEGDYIQQIIDARIENGLSIDKGNFIRQCVDFAIHFKEVPENHKTRISFATPHITVIKIKDGFFK